MRGYSYLLTIVIGHAFASIAIGVHKISVWGMRMIKIGSAWKTSSSKELQLSIQVIVEILIVGIGTLPVTL